MQAHSAPRIRTSADHASDMNIMSRSSACSAGSLPRARQHASARFLAWRQHRHANFSLLRMPKDNTSVGCTLLLEMYCLHSTAGRHIMLHATTITSRDTCRLTSMCTRQSGRCATRRGQVTHASHRMSSPFGARAPPPHRGWRRREPCTTTHNPWNLSSCTPNRLWTPC